MAGVRLTFGEWLKDKLLALEMTQGQLAVACGVSQGTVSYWANGETLPTRANAQDIAKALDVPLDEVRGLIADDRKRRASVGERQEVKAGKRRKPVRFRGRVPANNRRWMDMESDAGMIELPESWLRDMRPPLFAVEVTGDCLAARGIHDGDIVICEQVDRPDDVSQGRVVLVRIEDDVTLKVWHWVALDRVELRDGAGTAVVTLTDGVDFQVLGIARRRFGDVQ